jgi:hypothetical protein
MTQSTNKFEQLLELLINEENDKAQALFHEIVVEKSRDIYEGLAETETTVEAKEENKEEVKETEKTDSKDESVDEEVEIEEASKEEESIEEVSGDATDDLITDVEADEKGDAEHGAEDFNKDGEIDDHEKEHADVENKIVDLEDALEELKAEFEKMMSGDKGEEGSEEKSEESVAVAQDAQVEVAAEAKEEMKKETVKEYKIQKSADNKDGSDKSAKSPIVDAGTKMGHGAKNIAQADVAKEKAKVATAEKMGDFENTPGKDKATSYSKEVKADHKDGGDKSASKSPIVAAKK